MSGFERILHFERVNRLSFRKILKINLFFIKFLELLVITEEKLIEKNADSTKEGN